MALLTARRTEILNFVVREHVATAGPVSSEAVRAGLRIRVSAATVRHEMAALEEEGYLSRPHVSAGAVPSDIGYRYYVQQLLTSPALSRSEQAALRNRFEHGADRDVEASTHLATRMLSELVQNLAIVTLPHGRQSRLRHLEIVYLQELLIMLVLVFEGARLRKSLLTLQDPVDAETLGSVTNKLNAHFAGLSLAEMRSKGMRLAPFEERVAERTFDLMAEDEEAVSEEYLAEGLRHLLAQPEFMGGAPRARDLVEALEERRLLQALLTGAPQVGNVRVIIGGENQDEVLKPLSIVVGKYGVIGGMSGTVGIVGPTRMAYDHTMAGVRYLSSLMSELVEEVQGQPLPD